MLHHRRIVATAFSLLALVACRGAAPSLPGSSGTAPAHRRAAAVVTAPSFVTVGPFGVPGKINAFASDPKNPIVLYVASGRGTGLESYSSAGIYRSLDFGAHWQPVDRGLTDPSGAISSVVNALWLDPAHPGTLVAATEYDGLFRTTDGGDSWRNVYRTTAATQTIAYGGVLYAATAAGILASSDDGATWRVQLPATSTQAPTAFGATAGKAGSALYAGFTNGNIDVLIGGAWKKAGTLPYDAHTGTDGSTPAVHQIAVDPLAPKTVYASSNDGQWDQDLHGSLDGGRTWVNVYNQQIYNVGLGAQAIAFSAVHPHRLYVGTDGALIWIDADGTANPSGELAATLSVIDIRNLWTAPNGSDDSCFVASDQGLDYVPACSLRSNAPQDAYVGATISSSLARRFAVAPNGQTIVTSLQDWDSFYTTTGGKRWLYNFGNLYEDGFNELRPGSPNVCFAYDEAWGFRISTDGCVTYGQPLGVQKTIAPSRLMTTPIAFDPTNPMLMYVAAGWVAGAGFEPSPQAVFGSSDGGTTFHRLAWPVSQPGAVVVDASNGKHILVGGMKKGRSSLSVTFDGGKSWTSSRGVPATPFWYAITISPANGSTVLASSVDAANNVFVLRSSDGGRTFSRVATVVNAPLIRGRIDADRMTRGAPGRAAAGEEEEAHQPAFVYSPEREIRYNQDVTSGTPAVVITTLRGAYISTNDGTTWTRLDHDLIAHSFWGIRWVNGYLYLGSDGQGVLKSTAPVQLP
ncbi:MAG TPA: hypothetical protein VMH02_02015 [Verrucomicrobiae bacterium]|nr:hypothetical protein [Verrucomicrobiae bacterium]